MPDLDRFAKRRNHPNCRMCDIINRININDSDIYNSPLTISPNYVVIPALGHILEGYLMIVSKQHASCMGSLDNEALIELDGLKLYLRELLYSTYGPLIFFEHGSVSTSDLAGTSVIHAHTHVCPEPENFLTLVKEQLHLKSVEGQSFAKYSFKAKKPYILIENRDGLCFANNPEQSLPSQFLRRLLSTCVGLEEQWDWHCYPHKLKLISTISTSSSLVPDRNWVPEAQNTI